MKTKTKATATATMITTTTVVACLLMLAAGASGVTSLAAPPPARPASTPEQLYPVVGQVVPPFTAEGLDGSRVELAFPKGSTTVLLFFLSSCPTCHRMLPEWNRALQRLPKGVKVVGVLLDREPPGWFAINPVAFPVVRSPGREFLDTYKVHRVPVTVRIGAGGKILDVGQGVLDPIRLGDLFRP
jgi:thiol-disulfide isomerase/thioredoxin